MPEDNEPKTVDIDTSGPDVEVELPEENKQTYENKSKGDSQEYNHNVENYRNKYLISQKGGVLEFVNTDNREILKLTHYSGSFKEFNNKATIELATANDQKLVLADQFLTVKGNKNEYVDYDFDQIIRGDYYKKVGKLIFYNLE